MVKISFKRFYQTLIPGLFLGAWLLDISTPEKTSLVAEHAPWSCWFLKLTGWECPGCGMTRALISFFAFDFSSSFHFNPFGPVLGFVLMGFWAWSWRAKNFSFEQALGLYPRWATVPSLLLILGWGIFRNLLDV